MAVLDTLEILIEADSAGLTSQLKRASSTITSFVSQMNKQEVGWTQILSKSITPALMASIASTFAISIAQAMQFQNAVQKASLNTDTAFKDTTKNMTKGAWDMSTATGQSASDVQSALGAVSMVYKDYNDAQTVAANITTFAAAEHISMADALDVALPLLQQWNVSATDSGKVLATLGQSTSYGKYGISELSAMLAGAGPTLRKYTDLTKAITQVQQASAIPGFTLGTITNMFDIIVKEAQKTNPEITEIFGDLGNKIKTGGFGAAFDSLNTKIKDLGPLVASQFGIIPTAIAESMASATGAFSEVDEKAKKSLEAVKPLGDWWKENQTEVDKLKILFQEFMKALNEFVVPGAFGAFSLLMKAIIGDIQLFNDLVTGAIKTINALSSGDLASLGGELIPSSTSSTVGLKNAPAAQNTQEATNQLLKEISARLAGNSASSNVTNFFQSDGQRGAASATQSKLPTQMNNSFYGVHN